MKLKYAVKPEDEEKTVKAIGRDMDISFKDTVMISDSIRGMMLPKAIQLLEDVVKKKRPVKYTRFQKGVGHRKGTQVKVGKYPQKAARHMLAVLRNMEANAEFKGLEASKIKLFHVEALKGISRVKRKPKGRYATWNTEYVHLQLIGRET
jgi:large subunit ribosomal protein L22